MGYNLVKAGMGPRLHYIGKKPLVSHESDAEWILRMEQTKAHAKVEALSKPSPVPPPYKPAHPPASDDVPLVEDTRDAELAALAGVDRNPAAEAFREWDEQHDQIELRKASWASSVSKATGSVQDLWRRLEEMAKDKRADDWEMLPEEQEFIDALRRVAKEASKRFRPGVVVYINPAQLVVERDRE